jgi:hypothetical protein
MSRRNRANLFPHASRSFPSDDNPWSALKAASGTTPTENQLLNLARDSFLSLWSFPNVYTDEGRRGGNSDGKELCDLMVVFGDDVLLFSDKNCAFPLIDNLNLAWNRWYRRAVEKSAKQLSGAESWITRFPARVFLDAKCSENLPVQLPPADRRRVHMIAVAHGASEAAIKHWHSMAPGSTGTPIIDTSLVGRQHEDKPFVVGWPLENKRFVHVFDGDTISLILRKLDTLSDFVDYLNKKQDLFEKSGCEFLIMGEEELLAAYLTNIDPKTNEHRFQSFPPDHLVYLGEGYWSKLEVNAGYRSRAEANKISYLWDDLIEYQASHMIHGSSELTTVAATKGSEEDVLRVMASENRLKRRALGESVHSLRLKSNEKLRATRCIADSRGQRVYAMLALPYLPEQPHDEYRDYRQYLLHVYCEGAALQFPEAQEILGIAFEHYDSNIASVDFLYIRLNGVRFDPADRAEIEARLREEGIWQPSVVSGRVIRDAEFPYGLE